MRGLGLEAASPILSAGEGGLAPEKYAVPQEGVLSLPAFGPARFHVVVLDERASLALLKLSLPDPVGAAGEGADLGASGNGLRQAAEDAARLVEDARQTSVAKSEFMANISHEIRTPLNAIVGMTHLTLRTALTRQQREYVGRVDVAAKSLLRIVNDVLDFSKLEAGRLEADSLPFVPEEVARGVLAQLTDRAREKGLELELDFSRELRGHYLGDPLRLSRVLFNLAENALKFTERGRVSIGGRLEEEQGGAALLLFTVSDTGIGMNAGQLEGLFTPFTQADASSTRKYNGIGLGLALCRSLVEFMGGKICCESEVGRGTSFKFSIRCGSGEGIERGERPGSFADLHAVILGDNPLERETMYELLYSMGCHSSARFAGTMEAMEARRTGREDFDLDLLVVSSEMPEGDVRNFINFLAEGSGGAPPPTILVLADQDTPVSGYAGFNRKILFRPVSQSSLFDALIRLFRRVAAVPADQEEMAVLRGLMAEFSGARILLADDNELNQKVEGDMLSGAGLTVRFAFNGLEVLEALEREPFDLVILDIDMPVLDGLAAARKIRAQKRFASLPLIALTANALEEDERRSAEAGMDAHLNKPVHALELFSCLAECLRKGREREVHAGREETGRGGGKEPGLRRGVYVDEDKMRAQVLHNPAFYRNLFDGGNSSFAGLLEQMEYHMRNGQRESARVLAHTLTGIFEALGAEKAARRSKSLEHALHGACAEGAEAIWREAREDLRGVEADVSSVLAGADEEKSIQVQTQGADQAALLSFLEEIRAFAADSKPIDCKKAVEKGRAMSWPAEVLKSFEELDYVLSRYNFSGALDIIARMRALLGAC